MQITFLGTGASIGMPMIAFEHEAIDLRDRRNWRTRPGVHVVMDGHAVQIDAGQEFRLQCIEYAIEHIDTFILTHEHADHVLGMEDLRRFCTLRGNRALPVYSHPRGLQRVREVYPYAISDIPKYSGYSAFTLHEIGSELVTPGGKIMTTLLPHGGMETLGLIFEEASSGMRFAYYTDCKSVPAVARSLARGVDLLVLDALYYREHRSHMSIAQALEVAHDITAPMTYLTHLTYPVNHATLESELPPNIRVAYDGLRLSLEEGEVRIMPLPLRNID